MVAVIIVAHADRHGVAYPGIDEIARLTGLHRTTVYRAIPHLEVAGILTVTRRKGKANRYRLAIETPHRSLWDIHNQTRLGATPDEHARTRTRRARRVCTETR